MVGWMSWGMAGACQQGWRKGPWTPEEDKLLSEYVTQHGEGRWSSVSRSAGLSRSGKSCRLRWVNYLRPGLKRGQITPQEEGIIIELHALWGNKWSTIARYLPGRTDNEIKNYWRTHFKKRDRLPSRKTKARKLQTQKQTAQQGKTLPELQQEEVTGETTKAEDDAPMEDGQLINYPNNYQDAALQKDSVWSGSLWSFDDQQDKAPIEQEQLCSKVANMENQAATWNDFYANFNMWMYTDGSIF